MIGTISRHAEHTLRVNLLPAAYELRCRRTRQMRSWAAVCIAIVCAQIAVAVVLRQMSSQARQLQQGLVQAEQQQLSLTGRIRAIESQQADSDRQIRLADQLNCKHRWSELLTNVIRCMPDSVVLTKLESEPAKCGNPSLHMVTVRTPADKISPTEPIDVATGLVIRGMATDHDSVAMFLRNLNTRGEAGRCLLESTIRQPYLTGEGVLFTIKTQW